MKINKLITKNKRSTKFNKRYMNTNKYDFNRLINYNNGITLIALIIVIIVLLLLAGVTINMSLENNIHQTSGNAWEGTKENYIRNLQ